MTQSKHTGEPQLGLVKGKGTSTSDSIPAKLSKGEVVIPAAVAKHYGPAYFTKLIASVPKEKGARTEFKGGALKAAGGYVDEASQTKIPGVQRTGNYYSKAGGVNPGMDPTLSQPAGTVIRPDASQPVAGGASVASLDSNSSDYQDNYNRPGMQSMAFNDDGSFRSMDIKGGTAPRCPSTRGSLPTTDRRGLR